MIQTALFMTAILSLVFAVVIFINDARSTLFRLYFLFGIFSALWMSVNAVVASGPLQLSLDAQFQFAHLITPLALATSLMFYLFLRYFTQKKLGSISVVIALPSIAISAFAFTNLNIYLDHNMVITLGPLYPAYLIVLLVNLSLVFYSLYTARVTDINTRMQLRYLKLGAITAVVPTLAFGAILPIFSNSDLSNIGPLFSVSFLIFAGVAIVKHHLFDIKLAAVRGVAYILSLLTLSAVYYILAYGLSVFALGSQAMTATSPVNVILALILAFLFQPIKLFFDRATNNIFYRENYNSEEFFAELSNILSSTVDLRGLLERVTLEIAQTVKSSQAYFFLYLDGSSDHYMSVGTHRHTRLPYHDARQLDKFIADQPGGVILTDALTDMPDIRRLLVSYRIAVIVPLKSSAGVIGYLLLGEHLSGNYTKRDLNVLSTISSELVIAIQNALSLHEVKELNATLQQRIDVATKELRSSNAQLKHLDEVKDEFMSMASHQLRTPLTSVKGYLSMVLEGDAGDISPQQRKLLVEAYNSSERMVHLIADFLNVSRLQTGKFMIDKQATDLTRIIRQETASLKLIAESRQVKLKHVIPRGSLVVYADEAKVREVVMNFIDNAIFYSKAGSTVTVTLERDHDDALLAVTDQGIGVPEADQARLFNRFFRAANARKQRPDGTGVGLYLARKVITAHGGSVLFHSVEGQGSTFGFRLPVIDTTK